MGQVLLAGEVAQVVLTGGKVASEKIQKAGFNFQFATLREALEEIYTP